MYQDVEKFINLLNTDVSLQERMKDAAEKYDGKQTPEAAFQDLISPFAQEAGFDRQHRR